MARYASFGSSVAWYSGDVPEIKELQANFHSARRTGRLKQPHCYLGHTTFFHALKRYYKNPDLLLRQVAIAQEKWEAGEMNAQLASTSGAHWATDVHEMYKASDESHQMRFRLFPGDGVRQANYRRKNRR